MKHLSSSCIAPRSHMSTASTSRKGAKAHCMSQGRYSPMRSTHSDVCTSVSSRPAKHRKMRPNPRDAYHEIQDHICVVINSAKITAPLGCATRFLSYFESVVSWASTAGATTSNRQQKDVKAKCKDSRFGDRLEDEGRR